MHQWIENRKNDLVAWAFFLVAVLLYFGNFTPESGVAALALVVVLAVVSKLVADAIGRRRGWQSTG